MQRAPFGITRPSFHAGLIAVLSCTITLQVLIWKLGNRSRPMLLEVDAHIWRFNFKCRSRFGAHVASSQLMPSTLAYGLHLEEQGLDTVSGNFQLISTIFPLKVLSYSTKSKHCSFYPEWMTKGCQLSTDQNQTTSRPKCKWTALRAFTLGGRDT